MYLVSEKSVKKIATTTMANKAITQAFIAAYQNRGEVFPVVHAKGCNDGDGFSMKSGNLLDQKLCGVKIGSYWPNNHHDLNLPNHGTTTLLLDAKTGFPHALISAAYLNGLRTAAANAVATQKLARTQAKILGALGAGHQAIFEIKAVCEVREIKKIFIHSRNADTVDHAITELNKAGINAQGADVETVCRNADILITVTNATGALFEAGWIKSGTHISAMGADKPNKQELPVELVLNASIFADYPPQSIINGEYEAAFNINPDIDITAIGAVLVGDNAGRANDDQITIFDSSGIALQDLCVAKLVLDEAIKLNLSEEVEF